MKKKFKVKTLHSNDKGKNNDGGRVREKEEYETLENYLNIWQLNPTRKDLNLRLSNSRVISLVMMFLFITITSYLLTFDFYASISSGFLAVFAFLVIFGDQLFGLRGLLSRCFKKFSKLRIFDNIHFWSDEKDLSVLYLSNEDDLTTISLRIFKVEVIPETVRANLNQFVKSLYETKLRIPFTFQVVQAPIVVDSDNDNFNSRHYKVNSRGSFRTEIYLCTYTRSKGIVTRLQLKRLNLILDQYSNALRSVFNSNFHHFKVMQLAGSGLTSALRALILKNRVNHDFKEENSLASKKLNYKASKSALKGLACSFMVGYCSYALVALGVDLTTTILFSLAFLFFLVVSWWRNALFQISKWKLKNTKTVRLVNPFRGVNFYRFKKIPDSIFAHVDGIMTINLKCYNLKYASPPPFCFPDKFYRALIGHQIPFSYTVVAAPMGYYYFTKEASKHLNVRGTNWVSALNTELQWEQWLKMRAGAWRTILLVSAISYKYAKTFKMEHVLELEENLAKNAITLKSTFSMNFQNYELVPLEGNVLESALKAISLKNKLFRSCGTHLNYLVFQGKVLMDLIRISDELKKGLESKVAAEFNTPLYLDNLVTYGYTLNTEFLEEEIPAGFTLEQLQRLLVTNGTRASRELFKMKLVEELVKADMPSVVFDFNGNWSRLIRHFERTHYADRFLYFKLGSSFDVDLARSGIPFDTNNLEYLNYFLDAFAMSFQEHKRTVSFLREIIAKNDELDLSTIALDIQTKQAWEKGGQSNTLLSLLDEFKGLNVIKTTSAIDSKNDIDPLDFLKNDKTVIVDFSIMKDLELKIFLVFVIISKFIHYVNRSTDFYEKMLVIPHVDAFFEGNYLDKDRRSNLNYGKVDKFLDPLLTEGFGLIFSANQVHYLHPNLFNYLDNVVSFKATDKRDLAVLKHQMALQEIHGRGYYSSSRNTTYQIDYLKAMRKNEILVKRNDIHQPFPGIVDFRELEKTPNLSAVEIYKYMRKQGYDLELSERRLLESAKETLFEKDLGMYSAFLEEIVNFLRTIKSIDAIGNLYRQKLKTQLKKFIHDKAKIKTRDKKQLKVIRDDIFEILLKHGYLVENHPKKAGGGQSIRPSYAVGPKYDEALEDYFESKKKSLTEVSVETVEDATGKGFELEKAFRRSEDQPSSTIVELNDKVASETGGLVYELSEMHENLKSKNYESAVKIGKVAFRNYLNAIRHEFMKSKKDDPEVAKDLDAFFEALSRTNNYPFNKKETLTYIEKVAKTTLEGDIERKAVELYELLSHYLLAVLEHIKQYTNSNELNASDFNLNALEVDGTEFVNQEVDNSLPKNESHYNLDKKKDGINGIRSNEKRSRQESEIGGKDEPN